MNEHPVGKVDTTDVPKAAALGGRGKGSPVRLASILVLCASTPLAASEPAGRKSSLCRAEETPLFACTVGKGERMELCGRFQKDALASARLLRGGKEPREVFRSRPASLRLEVFTAPHGERWFTLLQADDKAVRSLAFDDVEYDEEKGEPRIGASLTEVAAGAREPARTLCKEILVDELAKLEGALVTDEEAPQTGGSSYLRGLLQMLAKSQRELPPPGDLDERLYREGCEARSGGALAVLAETVLPCRVYLQGRFVGGVEYLPFITLDAPVGACRLAVDCPGAPLFEKDFGASGVEVVSLPGRRAK